MQTIHYALITNNIQKNDNWGFRITTVLRNPQLLKIIIMEFYVIYTD